MNRATKGLAALLAAIAAACCSLAASAGGSGAAPGAGTRAGQHSVYAITGGTVYTLGKAGKIEHGTVLIRDGKIAAVGADVQVPDDAERIDASGKIVTPGIFDPESQFGVVEVGSVGETRDASIDSERFSAAFDVAAAINPRSVLIPVNRIAGVTRAMVAPRSTGNGHIINGRGAIIDLGSTRGFVHRDAAAMFASLGESGASRAGGSRAAALTMLREALQDARDYADNTGAYNANRRRDYALSRLDLQALAPVLAGKEPLVVEVNRASDIEAALRLAADFKLRLIVSGGAEAWMAADQLAAANVPVLLDPLQDLPGSFESLGSTLHNAARLQKAGVLIAFATGDTHNARNVTQAAGNAVANGLPWLDALKAMMLNPARIYGMDDRLGTLAQGKLADVVVWSGDPLQLSTSAEQVFIAGRKIPMVSRQTLLRDRYLQARNDGKPLPSAYIHP
ncbi:MAG TPA: amidohydrolase family protein [Rhodanobacteraceae bacterium]|nr:amidohydrolase family protein [Rhodanobacteraceae bacterium]